MPETSLEVCSTRLNLLLVDKRTVANENITPRLTPFRRSHLHISETLMAKARSLIFLTLFTVVPTGVVQGDV